MLSRLKCGNGNFGMKRVRNGDYNSVGIGFKHKFLIIRKSFDISIAFFYLFKLLDINIANRCDLKPVYFGIINTVKMSRAHIPYADYSDLYD